MQFLSRRAILRLGQRFLTQAVPFQEKRSGELGFSLCGAGLAFALAQDEEKHKPSAFFRTAKCGFISETEEEKQARKRVAVLKKADELYDNYLIDNVYNGLAHYKEKKDPQILWRLCRATCELAKQNKVPAQKKALMLEAWDYIQEARGLEDPKAGIAQIHKWYAIMIDYVAQYEGTKARLTNAYETEKELKRALELDGRDPTTWHILGVWHFLFADMSGWKRRIAGALFAQPPSSTYQEALDCFMKAESLDPEFYAQNLLMIGKSLIALGRKEEGILFLKRCYRRVVVSPDDYDAHHESGEILLSFGLIKDGVFV